MIKQKAIRLDGSEEVLHYLDGSIESETLEKILESATEKKLKKGTLIIVTYNQRVKGFNHDNPEWEDVEKKVRLGYLFKLYEERNGEPFRVKTCEEIENEAKMIARRRPILVDPEKYDDY